MITFENKVTNLQIEEALINVPATQKVSANDMNQIKSVVNGIKTKTDFLTVTSSADVDVFKAKLNNLTIPSSVNTDTLKSDILSAKTKTDRITVSSSVDLDNINSNIRTGIITVTGDTVLSSNIVFVIVNSSSTVNLTLPNAGTLPQSAFIHIKRLGSGNVIVSPPVTNNIDGSTTPYNYNVDNAVQSSSRCFMKDGSTDWYLI